jgi:hypothetical protein
VSADIYSFTIILYELFSGMDPFPGNFLRIIDTKRNNETPKIPPNFPPDLEVLVQLGWSQHPRTRPELQDFVSVLTTMLQNDEPEYNSNDKNRTKFTSQYMFGPDGEINQETLWKETNAVPSTLPNYKSCNDTLVYHDDEEEDYDSIPKLDISLEAAGRNSLTMTTSNSSSSSTSTSTSTSTSINSEDSKDYKLTEDRIRKEMTERSINQEDACESSLHKSKGSNLKSEESKREPTVLAENIVTAAGEIGPSMTTLNLPKDTEEGEEGVELTEESIRKEQTEKSSLQNSKRSNLKSEESKREPTILAENIVTAADEIGPSKTTLNLSKDTEESKEGVELTEDSIRKEQTEKSSLQKSKGSNLKSEESKREPTILAENIVTKADEIGPSKTTLNLSKDTKEGEEGVELTEDSIRKEQTEKSSPHKSKGNNLKSEESKREPTVLAENIVTAADEIGPSKTTLNLSKDTEESKEGVEELTEDSKRKEQKENPNFQKDGSQSPSHENKFIFGESKVTTSDESRDNIVTEKETEGQRTKMAEETKRKDSNKGKTEIKNIYM